MANGDGRDVAVGGFGSAHALYGAWWVSLLAAFILVYFVKLPQLGGGRAPWFALAAITFSTVACNGLYLPECRWYPAARRNALRKAVRDVQTLPFLVFTAGLVGTMAIFFTGWDAGKKSVSTLFGEGLVDLFRFIVIAVVALFVSKMFGDFRSVQQSQQEVSRDQKEVLLQHERTSTQLAESVSKLEADISKTESSVSASIALGQSVLETSGIATVLSELGNKHHTLVNLQHVLQGISETGQAAAATRLAAVNSTLKTFFATVLKRVAAIDTVHPNKLAAQHELTTPVLLPLITFLGVFDEFVRAEIGAIFQEEYYEFKTGFTHYAAAVRNIVDALKEEKDRYEFYTVLVKSPIQFLDYFNGEDQAVGTEVETEAQKERDRQRLNTAEQWLEFVTFNANVVRKHGLNYHRLFVACENQAARTLLSKDHPELKGMLLKNAARKQLCESRQFLVQRDEQQRPVLATDGTESLPNSMVDWPTVSTQDVATALGGLNIKAPGFVMGHGLSLEGTGMETDFQLCNNLLDALKPFHSPECMWLRSLSEDQYQRMFQSPGRPIDVFAIRDKEANDWVFCMGVMTAAKSWEDAIKLRVYCPSYRRKEAASDQTTDIGTWQDLKDSFLDPLFLPQDGGKELLA